MSRVGAALLVVLALHSAIARAESEAMSLARPVSGNIRFEPVDLVDQHGEKARFDDVMRKPQPTVISFSYTGCRTVCPLTNIVMQQLQGLIERNRSKSAPKLITLTIDPFTDSPQVMRRTAEQLGAGASWSWYSGDPANVFAVLAGLNYGFGDLADHPQRYLIIDAENDRYLLLSDEVSADQLFDFAQALAEP